MTEASDQIRPLYPVLCGVRLGATDPALCLEHCLVPVGSTCWDLNSVSVSVSASRKRTKTGAGCQVFLGFFGEPGRNRTFNQQIKSLLLCQLSYGPTLECEVGSAKCQVTSRAARRAHRALRATWRAIHRGLVPARVERMRDPACLSSAGRRPLAAGRWRARQDSNLRPTDSKSGALSN